MLSVLLPNEDVEEKGEGWFEWRWCRWESRGAAPAMGRRLPESMPIEVKVDCDGVGGKKTLEFRVLESLE